MLSSLALALFCLVTLQCATGAPVQLQVPLRSNIEGPEDIRSILKKASVISEVLDDFHPAVALTLFYPKSQTTVTLGNTFPPANASHKPNVYVFPLSDPATLSPTRTFAANKTYALVLTDPDATSRADPTMGEMCHWIVVTTIPSSENETAGMQVDEDGAYGLRLGGGLDISDKHKDAKQLIGYLAPAPPKGTGKHRYVFVVLVGEGNKDLTTPKERSHWGYGKRGKGVRDWAKENEMTVLGANFFYSEYEE